MRERLYGETAMNEAMLVIRIEMRKNHATRVVPSSMIPGGGSNER